MPNVCEVSRLFYRSSAETQTGRDIPRSQERKEEERETWIKKEKERDAEVVKDKSRQRNGGR